MKLWIFLFFVILHCITVDESGNVISGPKIFIKEQKQKKWRLSEVSLGPRWSEKDKTVPILIIPIKEDLPEKFILSDLPKVENQGRQASSTAFATGYLAMTYYYKKNQKINYICSPSFIYNLLNNGKDQGIEIYDSLNLLKNTGCPPIEHFPYKEYDYKIQPSSIVVEIANNYKIKDFARVDPLDIYQIASFLYQDSVIIATLSISENFLTNHEDTYEPSGKSIGKHTVGIIGYDLKKQKYLLFNSFGENWGKKGLVWISKEWFERLVNSAYVILK